MNEKDCSTCYEQGYQDALEKSLEDLEKLITPDVLRAREGNYNKSLQLFIDDVEKRVREEISSQISGWREVDWSEGHDSKRHRKGSNRRYLKK